MFRTLWRPGHHFRKITSPTKGSTTHDVGVTYNSASLHAGLLLRLLRGAGPEQENNEICIFVINYSPFISVQFSSVVGGSQVTRQQTASAFLPSPGAQRHHVVV